MTDATIAGWQKEAGIEPATGARDEALGELSRQAYELIRVIELERSGIRDGDGSWHGSHALDGTIDSLNRCWPPPSDDDLCPDCGAHMQGTHHPACEARDGPPAASTDETDRAMADTEASQARAKHTKLAHYATREPKSFIQIDGWYGAKFSGYCLSPADEHGRSMTASVTTELMDGADVRLLIAPGADSVEIVALLHQAAEWITGTPDILDRSSRFHDPTPHLVEPREEDDPDVLCRKIEEGMNRLPGGSVVASFLADHAREALKVPGDVHTLRGCKLLLDEFGERFMSF